MFRLKVNTLFLSSCLIASSISHTCFANNIINDIQLSASQQSSMGMELTLAKQVHSVPSAIFPAQASISLKTIRSISSPLSGQIIKLNYVHGPIASGNVIAEIESPDLLKIQEAFLATLSDLKISQLNLQRAKQLTQSGVSSTKNLQQVLSGVKKLSLNKEQHHKNLMLVGMAETAIQKLEESETLQPAILQIKAPIDGQLFDLNVKLGERVAKNQEMISLGETNPMILVVRIPVEMANDIQEEQSVDIVTMQRKGIVYHVDPMVDPMTQSVDIHIRVQNDDHKLRSGQLFKVRFLNQINDIVYQVPANAVSQYHGDTVVFIQHQKHIKSLSIRVVNITDKQLYFIPKEAQSSPLNVYIKGATAIKSALDAANESDRG